jgi:hypothetical protein
MSAVQYNCTEGYLKGCTSALETGYFRGYVNLPNLVKDEKCYFFMGINIIEPNIMLTFGDKLPDMAGDLIFVGATYQRGNDGVDSISDVLSLEPACFTRWFPQSPNEVPQPPKYEEWCVIPLNAFLVRIKDAVNGGNASVFEEFALFKGASAQFIESLATLKLSKGSIPNRIFCLPDSIEDEPAIAEENIGGEEGDEGDTGDDEVQNVDLNANLKTPQKRKSRSKDKTSTRRSSRANTLDNIVDGLGDLCDNDFEQLGDDTGFKMPRRSGRPKKAANDDATNTKGGGKASSKKATKMDDPSSVTSKTAKTPRRKYQKKGGEPLSQPLTPVYQNATPKAPPTVPALYNPPPTKSAADNFSIFLDQQHKTLDYDERLVGNYLTFAERYNNR